MQPRGTHTFGGVRGWPVPCPCPGRRGAKAPSGGAGLRGSLCYRSDPRSLPAPERGQPRRAALARAHAGPQRRCHLPGRAVGPGRTVLLGISSGIASVFSMWAHKLLKNITQLQKCSFSIVYHTVHPSPGRRARVCRSPLTTLGRNTSYMWRVLLCQGYPPGSLICPPLSARQFENSPSGSKHPAALTLFPAYSRPVQSVLRFCPLAPAPALVLHRAEELCTAVAPRLAEPLSCGAGFSQFKLLLGKEFHCFLRSFMMWGFHGALRGYKRYRNAKMVGLWLWCLVHFEISS